VIVKDFDIQPCTMRKEDPTWRFALGASPVTDGHVLRIATDDGMEGFGYASATPHMGSIQETLRAELDLFRPLVVGRDPRTSKRSCSISTNASAARRRPRPGSIARCTIWWRARSACR